MLQRPKWFDAAQPDTARALLRTTKPPTANTMAVMAIFTKNLRPMGRVRSLRGKKASSRRKNKKETMRIILVQPSVVRENWKNDCIILF
jgi:hypothetical protein